MDFTDLLPLIIIALVFLFGRSSKKKAEEAKRKAEMGIEGPTPGTMETGVAASATPASLQERLEQALREMQQRVEAESAAAKESAAPIPRQAASLIAAMEGIDLEEGDEFAREYAAPLDVLAVEPPVTSEQTEDRFAFHARSGADESTPQSYRESGFSEYRSARGLHFNETHSPAAVRSAGMSEFHEAHGLSHGRQRAHPIYTSAMDKQAEDESERVRIFENADDVRRAIIINEILNKPRALRRGRE